ncbi:hypothetical protein HY345_01865 [Candidatus Microgenomates bacterium]|nr:hypothetical protein [Candidatus Microgenomates bacterium]
MFKNILLFVKYPSVAAIIITIWAGSAVLLIHDQTISILTVIQINLIVSLIIGFVGFRVDKK